MMDVVENLLFVATGIPHPSAQNPAVALIWELALRDINTFLKLCFAHEPGRKVIQPNDAPLQFFVRVLSQNDSSLHRFARRMVLMDGVEADTNLEEVSAAAREPTGHYTAALRNCLTGLSWSDDVIGAFLCRPDGPVKTARMMRADRATDTMDAATYQAYCNARKSSFLTPGSTASRGKRKTGQENAGETWWSAVSMDLTGCSPLIGLMVAYLAAEILSVIVDLILVLRMDFRDASCLRYDILRGGSDLAAVFAGLAASDFVSAISVEEVRDVARVFGEGFLSDFSKSSVLLYI